MKFYLPLRTWVNTLENVTVAGDSPDSAQLFSNYEILTIIY